MNFTFSELSDNNAYYIKSVVNVAREATCDVYHSYKSWYSNGGGINTPATELLQGMWDNICPLETRPEPPIPPVPPFVGGQCPVPYSVEITTDEYEVGGGAYGTNIKYALRVMGPVRSVGVRVLSNSQTPNQIGVFASGAYEESYDVGANFQPYFSAPPYREFKNYRISKITPLPGYQDNCGNPSVSPPPPPERPPAAQITNITKTVNVSNTNVQVQVPVTISPYLDFDVTGPSIRVDVGGLDLSFNPSFNPTFNANLNPKFNLNPSVSFNFGLGGVSVVFGTGGSSNITIGGGSGEGDIIDCDICQIATEIKEDTDKIREILEYKPVYSSHAITNVKSTKQDGIHNIGYVEIDVVIDPNKNKIMSGYDADDVVYCGWIHWRKLGHNFEKQQLTTRKNVFYAPINCDGFSVCCTYGSKCNITYYTENKDN